ncbi:AAA family ATPase [Thiomicrorhabdus heinhorstiae]|uniref:MoxR family ATPase n=1 Tax=Thiomicrorhabdus heinhorstiae TaxID=2748010 RepID=A0ABS0BWC2_9GAMM|nr:MoxR family ATPase [Thiomicrorhabdus heinhorstiae]MBF6057699.1 MoxR family ATPase [Thiomicrorhabdus heinhorstiae]
MRGEFALLKQYLQGVIVGQEALLDKLMVALLTGGHVLLEGPPGLAKTTAVKALADGVHASFQRIQFTPDLMPGDVMGSEVLDPTTGRLSFVQGPIFNEIVLADEINRAPPKVQSALLEAMAEKQVTAGGQTRSLPALFLVLATQNPLEQSGTYPLPEAQLDRFMLHLLLDYPDESEELEILRRDRSHHFGEDREKVKGSLAPETVLAARRQIAEMHVAEPVERYMVALVTATRKLEKYDPEMAKVLEIGASPRASIALLHATSAWAWLQNRDFVTPEDVKAMLPDILRHRLAVSFVGRSQQWSADRVIQRLLDLVPVPVEA